MEMTQSGAVSTIARFRASLSRASSSARLLVHSPQGAVLPTEALADCLRDSRACFAEALRLGQYSYRCILNRKQALRCLGRRPFGLFSGKLKPDLFVPFAFGNVAVDLK